MALVHGYDKKSEGSANELFLYGKQQRITGFWSRQSLAQKAQPFRLMLENQLTRMNSEIAISFRVVGTFVNSKVMDLQYYPLALAWPLWATLEARSRLFKNIFVENGISRNRIQGGYQTFLWAAKQRAYLLEEKLLPLPCLSPPPTQIRNGWKWDQLAKTLWMKFEIQMLQILWKIDLLHTSTGLQILVTSTYVPH